MAGLFSLYQPYSGTRICAGTFDEASFVESGNEFHDYFQCRPGISALHLQLQ